MTQIRLDDLLRTAVEQANAGRESSLYYSFDTPAGAVEFYVYITLDMGSSSAKPGKIVNIRSRRKT